MTNGHIEDSSAGKAIDQYRASSEWGAAGDGPALQEAGCVIPNLEDFTVSVADMAAAEMIFARCAAYCGHKKRAMQMRLEGDIQAATASEKAADDQYNQLPAWVRW